MTQEEAWLLKEKYNGEKTEGFFADCERLRLGEPLAYIIGDVPFLNTKIFLANEESHADVHPLIPRAETEYWVEKAIAEMRASGKKDLKVLDLCAGSGCIGVAVLTAIPEAHVDFQEIDVRLHPIIKRNSIENNIDETRIRIIEGNLFEHITDRYDYILTNPPYIDPTLDRTSESVRAHEPSLALYGGRDGLELIMQILNDAIHHLEPHGILFIEHEPEQVPLITACAKIAAWTIITKPDQYGVPRYTRLTRENV